MTLAHILFIIALAIITGPILWRQHEWNIKDFEEWRRGR
jgi:hypothetical protein